MKISHRFILFAAALALSAASLHADTWVAPLPTGSNITGDGTQQNPYATISYAFSQVTTPGDTIRVMPGDYFDTVNATGVFIEITPGVWVDKWVHIVADNPDPSLTTIIGDWTNPVVKIGGSGGSLQGFTVIQGGESAVVGVGTASIVDNVIDANEGTFGGGVRIDSNTCLYGESVVSVIDNTITNNLASSDGGGVFVWAGVDSATCQSHRVSVLIEGNTITGNSAADDGGGLELRTDTFPNFLAADITVRDNIITGNLAAGDAGGLRVRALGEGSETVVVTGNTIDLNTAFDNGGGLVAQIEISQYADHRVLVDDNSVTNNTATDDAGGMQVGMFIDEPVQDQSYSMIVSNNFIDHNVSTGIARGGGGVLARYDVDETTIAAAELAEFKITGNTISYNDSSLKGGGVAVYVLTNRVGATDCEITGFPATAQVDVENNLIIRNNALLTAPGAGAYVSLESCLNSFSRAEFVMNTIAKNDTNAGAGGVDLNFLTDPQGVGQFLLSHSIVWDNTGGAGLGGPIPTSNFVVDVEYSDVDSHNPDYETWIGNRTGIDGNVSENPDFVGPNFDDFHIKSISPAVEAGSRRIGVAPPTDFEGNPRVADADHDDIFVVDMGADEYFVCTDADRDGFGDPVGGGDDCTLDNCPADYNPGQSDCDVDSVGDVCDPDTVDADGDGVDVACDSDDADPHVCIDLDGDSCDDCTSGVAYPLFDGPDFDFDGVCDVGDSDDDDDGALDGQDTFPFDPYRCGDADGDGCGDDCAAGYFDPFNDGPDFDGDGLCDVGDPDDDNDGVDDGLDSDPFNATVCMDSDLDTCDDCTSGTFDPFNDGIDGDLDGRCVAGDSNDADPFACADDDADTCDDCSNGLYDPLDDGPDFDQDGVCDAGDPDDDNDGAADGDDCAPFTTGVSSPVGDVGPTLRIGPAKDRLSWVDIPSSHVFNVYRGQWLTGEVFVYNHVCRLTQEPGTEVMDLPGLLLSGRLYYYLVSGKNTCGEGTLGLNSSAVERPNDNPCAGEPKDHDDDGIVDIDDNCVLDPNPTQTDGDYDTVGDACDNCPANDNVAQQDFDGDDVGDACDLCTDTDGDGWGDPGFPLNTCGDDNCPHIPNSGQFDGDGDGIGNPCDPCPSDPGNDDDGDGVCLADDNCPDVYNPQQGDFDGDGDGDACDVCTDTDGDGFGDPGFPYDACPDDNCPSLPNPGQGDFDGDLVGDACDLCTDIDNDGWGNPGFPVNTCPDDNCPFTFNPLQQDRDGDDLGDVCDPCFDNPDPGCVACPGDSDSDGDGICHPEIVFVEEGTGMDYLANSSDPSIPGIDWVAEDYVVDTAWQSGVYGVGYDTTPGFPNALDLISTSVPPGSSSVYTRASFDVVDPSEGLRIEFGIDYDDGAVAWLNGVEIYRSDEMPAGDPAWDTASQSHESSNQSDPVYAPIVDVTAQAQPFLNVGTNVLAVGIWNDEPGSSDLVLVPWFAMLTGIDNCTDISNPLQEDADGDGQGDPCDLCTDTDDDGFGDPGFPANTCPEDNCPDDFNPGQEDFDSDGMGDVCDICPFDETNPDADSDGVCDTDDNCPDDYNPNQEDDDLDGVGNVCDNCPDDSNSSQDDLDLDGEGDVCDLCTDSDGDGYGNPGFPANTCLEDNCPDVPNDQVDADGDGLGDVCDPCFQNPDLGCVACPDAEFTDPDGDGDCDQEIVPVVEGTGMDYLANTSDPGIGLDWIEEGFVPGTGWQAGVYGIGYDNSSTPPNAHDLITTYVPAGTQSVYTRASFDVADAASALQVFVGADWDDGYVFWLNGVELFRSAQMPPGDPAWNQSLSSQKEPSNQTDPVYAPLTDVTTAALGALHNGTNVAAIGVWNASPGSSDLVLVPRLSIKTALDNCPGEPNPGQADDDGDGVGNLCDNCPQDFNPGQEDTDGDGIGDACDPS